jgi:hypothetical protein
MTDTELFEIVKGHREAWPRDVGYSALTYSFEYATETTHIMFELEHAVMMFEAAFHRALLAKGDVYVTPSARGYTIDLDGWYGEATTLIECYAKALEWRKLEPL